MTTNQVLLGVGLILVRADGRLVPVTRDGPPPPEVGDTMVLLGPAVRGS